MLRYYSVDARREYDRAFQRLLDLRVLNRKDEERTVIIPLTT